MERKIYDSNLIKIMSMFESITRAKLKDAVDAEQLLFIVDENQIGKAIGKKGVNVKRLEQALNKKIKVVEFSPDPKQFIENMLYPLKPVQITEENGRYTINAGDTKTRGLMIGRDAKNIKFIKEVAKRYFEIEEIKVAQQ